MVMNVNMNMDMNINIQEHHEHRKDMDMVVKTGTEMDTDMVKDIDMDADTAGKSVCQTFRHSSNQVPERQKLTIPEAVRYQNKANLLPTVLSCF
jgi:hypothetical protein